jgi:hypothetical protein
MAEFDFSGLLEFLAGVPFDIVVAERDQRGGRFAGRVLELDVGTIESFRAEALKYLLGLEARELLDHQELTLLSDTQASVTGIDILEPGLLDELHRAAGTRPGAEGDPVPERIRLYALVAGEEGGHRAVLLRRQNPVRHLRSGITRLLFHSRLEEAPPVFVYDGRFDLVVWDGRVLIAADNALDSLFEDEQLRRAQTGEAVAALGRHVRSADWDRLKDLEGDRAMGAKVRKLWKAGVFDEVDLAALPRVIREFDLDLELEDGRLVLPVGRRRQWEMLALVEEGFVLGAATSRRYRANSKFVWTQRIVQSVRFRGATPTDLIGPGPWSPVRVEDAADDVIHRKIVYRVRDGEELRALLIAPNDDDGWTISIPGPGGDELLDALRDEGDTL